MRIGRARAAGVRASLASAAVRDYYFTPLGSQKGLVQNSVTAFAQDDRGFVWVATQGGLHRYDGQRFVAHRHDPADPSSLPDSFVTALAATGDALWVGTYTRYVSRLDLRSGGRIQRFLPGDGDDAGAQVMALLPQRGGCGSAP